MEQLTSTREPDRFRQSLRCHAVRPVRSSEFKSEFPAQAASLAGAEYAQTLPSQPGAADVIKDLNAKLATLKTSDPKTILDPSRLK